MQALRISLDSTQKPTLSLTKVPKPTASPGYALVKVHAAAINPSDALNSRGGFDHTTFPRTPGRDFAGTVEAGSSAWLGRAVYGTSGRAFSFTHDGAHAEYCIVPEAGLVAKPAHLSFVEAAQLGVPYTTAALTLERAAVQPDDVVMVLGATGAVGSAAMQLARRAGYRTIGVARSDAADVNPSTDAALDKALALTGGKGPDVVIDTVGDEALTLAALKVLGLGGRHSFISAPRGATPEVTIHMKNVYRKEQTLVGTNTVAPPHTQERMAQLLASMNDAFEAGELLPVAASRVTVVKLADAVAAYSAKTRSVITFE